MIDKSYYYLSHKIRLFYDFYSKHTTMVTKKLCILRFFWFLCSKTHYYVSQLIIILLKKYNFYRIYAQKLDTMVTKNQDFVVFSGFQFKYTILWLPKKYDFGSF